MFYPINPLAAEYDHWLKRANERLQQDPDCVYEVFYCDPYKNTKCTKTTVL